MIEKSRRGLFRLFGALAAAPVAAKIADALPVEPETVFVDIETAPNTVAYQIGKRTVEWCCGSYICGACEDVDGGCDYCNDLGN